MEILPKTAFSVATGVTDTPALSLGHRMLCSAIYHYFLNFEFSSQNNHYMIFKPNQV